MRGVQFVFLGAAIVAGVAVVALVQSEIDSARRSAQPVQAAPQVVEIPKAEVLVMASAVGRGRAMTPGAMTWREWPMDAVPDGAITRAAEPEAIQNFTGALVRQNFVAGEPVMRSKLVLLDVNGVMSALLREGMRALAIEIAPETGVGGFILPGDFVDVILTRENAVEVQKRDGSWDEQDFLFTDTLLTSVRVLAIDTVFETPEDPSVEPRRTATMEVTPDMAELLSLADEAGRITLSLRAFADSTTENGEPPMPQLEINPDRIGSLRIGSLTGSDYQDEAGDELAESAADARPRSVTVVRAGARSEAAVD